MDDNGVPSIPYLILLHQLDISLCLLMSIQCLAALESFTITVAVSYGTTVVLFLPSLKGGLLAPRFVVANVFPLSEAHGIPCPLTQGFGSDCSSATPTRGCYKFETLSCSSYFFEGKHQHSLASRGKITSR